MKTNENIGKTTRIDNEYNELSALSSMEEDSSSEF